jgi:predicted lactoylglutathione lyase
VGNGVVVGIAVDSHDKVERIHRKALELVASTKAPSACAPRGGGGFYSGYFRDLDGNKLDLFCYG